jgi:UDP-glucose 6-dehydrogenase
MDDMRDSPGFKIIKELIKLKIDVVGFDPFFKKKLEKKYLKENDMPNYKINVISKLSSELLKKYSCLVIVQHHSSTKARINEIYQKSLIPIIYDCQNKLERNSKSKSMLNCLGFSQIME